MSEKIQNLDEAIRHDLETLVHTRKLQEILEDPSKSLKDCFRSIMDFLGGETADPEIQKAIRTTQRRLAGFVPRTNLEKENKGTDVENLQRFLMLLGYLRIPKPTGYFGDKTEESVARFQVDTRIIKDKTHESAGMVGPKTRDMIRNIANLVSNILSQAMESTDDEIPEKEISPGEKGEAVRKIQEALMLLGYLHIEKSTGIYGDKTKDAVADFQVDYKVVPSVDHPFAGYFGKKTANKLKSALRKMENPMTKKDAERLTDQYLYMHALEDKYSPDSDNLNALAALYRFNKNQRSYVDELRRLNGTLPPMSEKCKISVCLPAYNEEKNIEQTLKGWVEQTNPKNGKPLDPETFEILILVNKPNGDTEYDRTMAKIKAFQRKYPKYNIRAVQHTFNFDKYNNRTTILNGRKVEVKKGIYMGAIYKTVQDLALLRNLERDDETRKARHLFRSNGADTESRNPYFLDLVFKYFEKDPELDRYRTGSDYPEEAYQKMPLYHVAHRVRSLMGITYTKDKLRSPIGGPGSNLGLGTYRAGLYAQAGGFTMNRPIAEEVNLSSKLSALKPKNKSNLIINAIGNPRRSILALKNGVPLFNEYDTYATAEGVRSSEWRSELNDIPPHAELNIPNLERELSVIMRGYIAIMMRNKVTKTKEQAFDIASKMMRRCLIVFGIGFTPQQKTKKNQKAAEHFSFVFDPIGNNHQVKITNIDYLKSQLEKYRHRKPRSWKKNTDG